MKVIPITPRGYCKGVVNAINIAKQEAGKKDIYILGMIVHNQFIVDALEQMGIQTIPDNNLTREEMLEKIDHGTVIFTAHGVSKAVVAKAKQKGLKIIDATCVDVIKTHQIIQKYLDQGYEILYIGKQNHPEAMGATAIDKNKIHLITNSEDFTQLDPNRKYMITNQTTMSIYDVYHLFEKAKTIFPKLVIASETCQATRVRQEAVKNIPAEVDVIFIVGDPRSNNTNKLKKLAQQATNATVYMVATVSDITPNMLQGKKVAAVSSGASTPTYLTNLVISYLKQYNYNDPTTYHQPQVELSKII